MKKESLTKEIDWFCHHTVSERLLTKDECVAVIEAIEEGGATVDLATFLQVVRDNNLCQDIRLESLAKMSRDEARVFGFPSRSVFDAKPAFPGAPQRPAPSGVTLHPKTLVEAPKPATPPAMPVAGLRPIAPSAKPAPAPQAATPPAMPVAGLRPLAASTASAQVQPASPVSRASSAAGPDWLKGWPHLADAEGMDREAARQLLNDFLHKARAMKCSDIHISAGAVPFVRRYKQVFLLPDQEVLTIPAAEALNFAPLDEKQRAHFDEHHDLDYGYNISTNDRYRTNVMMQRLGVSGSYRVVDTEIRNIRELGFKYPEVVEKLTTYGQGLILVTGPAGSGKSTTLSALVDYINKTRHDHIITVEDPIEVVHTPQNCNVTQRELNRHTKSFGNALRAALREDPDVIVIGEMRDLETIEMAIHSSETGHLVIGTLHTSSAADTMNRILDVFPHGQQAQIRAMVAESLKGVICQQLLPNKNGDGVVLAAEILLGTLAVSNLIREGKTYQIDSTIQTNKNLGMITMEQSHFDLYMAGKRSYEQTIPFVHSNELVRQMQQQEAQGLAGTTAVPLGGAPAPRSMPQATPEPPKKRGWFR